MKLSDKQIEKFIHNLYAKLNPAMTIEEFKKEIKKMLKEKNINEAKIAEEETKKIEHSQAKPTYLEYFDEIFEMFDKRYQHHDPERRADYSVYWDPKHHVRDIPYILKNSHAGKLGKVSDLREDPVKLKKYIIRIKKINEVLEKVINHDEYIWNKYNREKTQIKPKQKKEFKQKLDNMKDLSKMINTEYIEGQQILESMKSNSKTRSRSGSSSGGRRRTMKKR